MTGRRGSAGRVWRIAAQQLRQAIGAPEIGSGALKWSLHYRLILRQIHRAPGNWEIHWHDMIRNKCLCNHWQSHRQNDQSLSSSFIAFETAKLGPLCLRVELKCGVIKSWQAELLAIFRAHTKSFPWIILSVCTDRRELFRAIQCVITAYPVCPEEDFF